MRNTPFSGWRSALRALVLGGCVLGCASSSIAARAPLSQLDPKYPPHWWTPVNDPNPPSWEILPQAAGPGEVILSKRNELGLLSNFAATPFTYRGKHYASLEGFWQAMLYPENPRDPRAVAEGLEWKYTRAQVEQMVAFEAKAAGSLASANMKKLGIDWVSFEGRRFRYHTPKKGEHYRWIREAMEEKVAQNANVKEVLLATGDLKLLPDHHQDSDAPPAWKYFDIYMEIRATLQAEARRKSR